MSKARERFRNFKAFESPPQIYKPRKRSKQPAVQRRWADWVEKECEKYGELNEDYNDFANMSNNADY